MKKALTCAALIALSGCATVSMVSKDAVVESGSAEHSTALEESATAFNTRAEARGWVGEKRGLFDAIGVIFGRDKDDASNPRTYADRVDAKEAPVATVYEKVADDAEAAIEAFADVQSAADRLLKTGACTRTDVINFETAMVTAQKTYRGFSEAVGIAAGRDATGVENAEAMLAELAGMIDTARDTADLLADSYAMPSVAGDEDVSGS